MLGWENMFVAARLKDVPVDSTQANTVVETINIGYQTGGNPCFYVIQYHQVP
ncbi:hypothetical protein SAMN05428952_10382 [Nitrosomonas sp. Nm132]|jgi:hypothetical protein|nr:hypothetical protein SAMN05428952_10382 [Nitrosomonas sp. Nm132]